MRTSILFGLDADLKDINAMFRGQVCQLSDLLGSEGMSSDFYGLTGFAGVASADDTTPSGARQVLTLNKAAAAKGVSGHTLDRIFDPASKKIVSGRISLSADPNGPSKKTNSFFVPRPLHGGDIGITDVGQFFNDLAVSLDKGIPLNAENYELMSKEKNVVALLWRLKAENKRDNVVLNPTFPVLVMGKSFSTFSFSHEKLEKAF